jgi:subtilisin-like proprotein convertase family protein
LPQNGQIVSGTYKPTAYFPVPTFPAPASLAPYPTYATNLSTFKNSNPNGTWSLFVIDDSPLNVGAISNGWSLNVITASPIASQPLQLGGFVSSNGTFRLTITCPAISTIIQASTNLGSGIWVNIYTNSYTNSQPWTFTDSNSSSYSYRFYRVIPAP